jgi:hypothetical protein
MTTATLTPAAKPQVEILDGLSYAPGVKAVLIGGKGYWVKDLVTHFTVAADDGSGCYVVRPSGGKARACNCPDAVYRKRVCKHCHAVEAVMAAW